MRVVFYALMQMFPEKQYFSLRTDVCIFILLANIMCLKVILNRFTDLLWIIGKRYALAKSVCFFDCIFFFFVVVM